MGYDTRSAYDRNGMPNDRKIAGLLNHIELQSMSPVNKLAQPDKKEIERMKSLLLPVFKESKAKRAFLFGSLSKGTGTRKSDVDLMIETETQKRFFDRYEDFEKIPAILSDRSVDMLIYTSEELSKISHRAFIKNIIEDGVILYER